MARWHVRPAGFDRDVAAMISRHTALGGILAATRVILLAHWLTDVAAGLVIGLGIEKILSVCVQPEDAGSAHGRSIRRIP